MFKEKEFIELNMQFTKNLSQKCCVYSDLVQQLFVFLQERCEAEKYNFDKQYQIISPMLQKIVQINKIQEQLANKMDKYKNNGVQ